MRFPRRRLPVLCLLSAVAAVAAVACLAVRSRLRPARAALADGRLRFAVCQYDSRPDAYDWNLRHALAYAREAVGHGAGFVILPEFSFCTADDALNGGAFPFFRRNAEEIERRLARFSRRNRCYLLANIPHEEPGRTKERGAPVRKNRSMLFDPSGRKVATYDKKHVAILDSVAGIGAGEDEMLVGLPFGSIGLMVCRDASYPETFPSYRKADVVLAQFAYITDWTEEDDRDPIWLSKGMETSHVDFPRVGKKLARAFERPFVLFANKTGFEPNGGFTGGSCAISRSGRVLAQAGFGSDILYMDAALDEDGRLTDDDPVPFRPCR